MYQGAGCTVAMGYSANGGLVATSRHPSSSLTENGGCEKESLKRLGALGNLWETSVWRKKAQKIKEPGGINNTVWAMWGFNWAFGKVLQATAIVGNTCGHHRTSLYILDPSGVLLFFLFFFGPPLG